MNKLTIDEVSKVFAMYLGCQFWDTSAEPGTEIIKIDSITSNSIVWDTYGNDIPLNEVKLLLTPLDKITDEHAKVVGDYLGFKSFKVVNAKAYIKGWLSGDAAPFVFHPSRVINIYQYLISKGYAVPLWFGIDHWANGMTAIQLGIAIDITKTK